MQITEELVQSFKSFHERFPNPRLSKFYGIDAIAKKYLGFPDWFPLAQIALLEHGIALQYKKFHGKWQQATNEILCVDTKVRKDLLTGQNKDSIVLGPLFVHARRVHNIQPNKDAKGTLVYPVHSAYNYEMKFDWDKYIQSLLALPEKYHPFTASIYWLDVMKGKHKLFEKYGIKTVTNGHLYDPDFTKNCVDYIAQHKYTTGNELVSTLFYAVEMGVPFFIFGRDQKSENDNPEYRKEVDNDPHVVKLRNLFTKSADDLLNPIVISKEQKEIVDFYLDETSWMKPDEVRKYIYKKTPGVLLKKIFGRN